MTFEKAFSPNSGMRPPLQVGSVAMAKPRRPASESYQSACSPASQSISHSLATGIAGLDDEADESPIFSVSKSSMDVVMATGPPHKRDPAWTGIDLRRSSSTSTHSDRNSLRHLHPQLWQQVSNLQSSFAGQNTEAQSPPALSGRWNASMQRWSRCSGSTHSRSSTPDTIVWRGSSSRPCSLTQEAPSPAAPDSPLFKTDSPVSTPSPFISPLLTPTLTPSEPPSPQTHNTQQQEGPPTTSPLVHLQNLDDGGFLENNSLLFRYPSPIPSSPSLEEGVSLDPGVDGVMEDLPSPEPLSEVEGQTSPVDLFNSLMPDSAAEGHESGHRLDASWPTGQNRQRSGSTLVYSLSDSQLLDCCRCTVSSRQGIKPVEALRENGTMTSEVELVDAAVQTLSPVGSWWDLRRNTSNLGSHSILGSPPGSRLNLKSSVGSNSNLVSPSSSMFPVSSGEDEGEEKPGDDPKRNVNSSNDLERRRSCLKIQGEDKDELGRRSSMKQVQWDEDGMTWDVHGASVDPEVLSTAIQKHLELQNCPRPSKKKNKAPQPPPAEQKPPVMDVTSPCQERSECKETPVEGWEVKRDGGGGAEEPVEAIRRISRAEGANVKDDEVYGTEGAGHPKSPSTGSRHSRKRSVIRSLSRPGWCGSSRKALN